MKRQRKRWLIITVMIIFFPLTIGTATEVQKVETHGSIGFTGVYEPIGKPDPKPPESIVRPPITEIAKPGGVLPQTNDMHQSWFLWIGVALVSFVFLIWKRKKNRKQLNTKQ